MSIRIALSALLPALLLAIGCAPAGVSRPWDPDRPVLPLRMAMHEGQSTPDAQPDPGSPPTLPPGSYVMLLEDDDGSIGAVVIDGPEGRIVLDRPGILSLDSWTVLPETAASEQELARDHGPTEGVIETLEFEPRAPAGFEIYFDSDESEPTPESLRQLSEILDSLADWPVAEIQLSGHGDRFGSVGHNERLSRRRAEAMRDALVAGGARVDLVEVTWHGELRPAVATADGVREARNRRVEIRIR